MCPLACLLAFAFKVCENDGAKFLSVGVDSSKSAIVMCLKNEEVFSYAYDKIKIVGMDSELKND